MIRYEIGRRYEVGRRYEIGRPLIAAPEFSRTGFAEPIALAAYIR
jgi:hypothetical protein